MSINDFVELWNTSCDPLSHMETGEPLIPEDMFYRQYGEQEDRAPGLRLSQMYKPFGFLLLDRMGLKRQETYSLKSRYNLVLGDFWEATIIRLLKEYGFPVDEEQRTVTYKGVNGHIDFMYNGDTVVDVKTMSHQYFSKFVKEPNDDRGYITQLLCYSVATNAVAQGFLCLNKLSGELAWVPIDFGDQFVKDEELVSAEMLLERVDKVIDRYEYKFSLRKIVQNFLTTIVPIRYAKGIKLPESIRYDMRSHMIWKIDKFGFVQYTYTPDAICENLVKFRETLGA